MHSTKFHDLERLAVWMDSKFSIPGTSIRFGLDSLFGLIPGIGDTGTALVTLYLINQARQYDLPASVQRKMLWNAFIDWLIGLVPLVGDIFDIRWKANMRNVALLRTHLTAKAVRT